ncbi:hypothetical protein [Aeromonas sobria]|uniref:hypothetical protein n=1 Tax=Aeromonas sobria TaxID=646 RepID=UPI0012FECB21|nr:hypothetical protein [Aeromonas sobria]
MTVHMGWRELRHGFDRQLSFAQQIVGQLPGRVARQHPRAQASRHGQRMPAQVASRWRSRAR